MQREVERAEEVAVEDDRSYDLDAKDGVDVLLHVKKYEDNNQEPHEREQGGSEHLETNVLGGGVDGVWVLCHPLSELGGEEQDGHCECEVKAQGDGHPGANPVDGLLAIGDGDADAVEQWQNQRLLDDFEHEVDPRELRGDVEAPITGQIAEVVDSYSRVNSRQHGGQQ